MRTLGAIVVCLVTGSAWAQTDRVEQLSDTSLVRFASVEEGMRLISARDAFIDQLGDLEMQIRLGSQEPVDRSEYLQSVSRGVIAWQGEEVEQVSQAIRDLRRRFGAYALPFPAEIQLIRVKAEVEANAPHCRGSSIVLPDSFFGKPSGMVQTLAHELFHVLSSHNLGLRDELYALIGFERCGEIRLPAALMERRLTNPDAPANHHYITLKQDGQTIYATPVIFCKTGTYREGGLFQNLEFKLMILESSGGSMRPKLVDDQPQLVSPGETPDYLRQIGRNTGYIIHPEETLADNFWMLVLEASDVPDPWVIRRMREVLVKR